MGSDSAEAAHPKLNMLGFWVWAIAMAWKAGYTAGKMFRKRGK